LDTVSYGYGDSTWKDKLTSYDGTTITYDDIGNPLSHGTWSYTWTQGRRLQQISDGSTTASYKYNDAGIRTEKTVNGVTTIYQVVGDRVTWEKKGTNNPIYYLYDASGNLWGMKYTDGNVYFYIRNGQGDIIGLVDEDGDTQVEYLYDAWGRLMGTSGNLASTVGADNPYRYRGYRYDAETGLYYLQSRYYNPEWGRFVNADDYHVLFKERVNIIDINQYAYCHNNPVIKADANGYSPWSPRLSLADYWIIHSEVADNVALSISHDTYLSGREVYENGIYGIGIVDVYDKYNNMYYEVKSIGAAFSNRTQKQMNKYDNSRAKYQQNNLMRGTKQVKGFFCYGAWRIDYYLAQPGLVVYETSYSTELAKKAQLFQLALFAVITVGVIVTGGAAAPIYAFAY